MLTALILAAALVYLWAATRKVQPLVYVLKPGTMLLILWLAAGGVAGGPAPAYGWAVMVGLLCSLAGDVFLMLPRERFVAGLASFLAAHLFYIWALWAHAPARLTAADAATGLALALAALAVFRPLAAGIRARGQSRLMAPVALYVLVISAMVWRAAGSWFQPGPLPFRPTLVAAGALLFYASDAALAWDKFVRPLPGRDLLVMGTYFAAQYCFAASVAWPPAG